MSEQNTGEEVETFESEDEDEETDEERQEPEQPRVTDKETDDEDEDTPPEREQGVDEVELAEARKAQEAAGESSQEHIERLTGAPFEQAEYTEPFLAGGIGANAAVIQRDENASKIRREQGLDA